MKPPFYRWLQKYCDRHRRTFSNVMGVLSNDKVLRGVKWLETASVDELRGYLVGESLELRFDFEEAALLYEGSPDV